MHNFLYLASQSPRRSEILQQLGVKIEYLLPDQDENSEALEELIVGEPALDYVKRVTLSKLKAAQQRWQKRQLTFSPILCADTTVSLKYQGQEVILGKPRDADHAHEILSLLNGRKHLVHTALAICSAIDKPPLLKISSSEVEFAMCSEALISAYVKTGEPLGKAGAYGIQGIGGALIASINGSYSGIMGLPIYETSLLLDAANVKYALSPSL